MISFIFDFFKIRVQYFYTLFLALFPNNFSITNSNRLYCCEQDSDFEEIPKSIPKYGQKKVYMRISHIKEEELSGAVWPRLKGKNGIRSQFFREHKYNEMRRQLLYSTDDCLSSEQEQVKKIRKRKWNPVMRRFYFDDCTEYYQGPLYYNTFNEKKPKFRFTSSSKRYSKSIPCFREIKEKSKTTKNSDSQKIKDFHDSLFMAKRKEIKQFSEQRVLDDNGNSDDDKKSGENVQRSYIQSLIPTFNKKVQQKQKMLTSGIESAVFKVERCFNNTEDEIQQRQEKTNRKMSGSPEGPRKVSHVRQSSTDQDIMPQKVNGAYKNLAQKYKIIRIMANSHLEPVAFMDRCPSQYQKVGVIIDKLVNSKEMDLAVTWLGLYQNYHKVIIKQFPKDLLDFKFEDIEQIVQNELNYYKNIQTVENIKYVGTRHNVKLNIIIEDEKDLWMIYENQVCKTSLAQNLFEVKHNKRTSTSVVNHGIIFSILLQNDNIVRTFIEKMCQYLILMQKNQMVHGQLSPENVFLNMNQSIIYNCKVTDYSLSRKFEDLKDVKLDDVQRPEYYPPEMLKYLVEQCDQDQAGQFPRQQMWSLDMWSLGVILLEILLGQPIWMNESFDVNTCGHMIAKKQRRGSKIVEQGITRQNCFREEVGIFGVKNKKPRDITPVFSNEPTPKKIREQLSSKKKRKETLQLSSTQKPKECVKDSIEEQLMLKLNDMKYDPSKIMESPRDKKQNQIQTIIRKQQENVTNILQLIDNNMLENSIYGLNQNRIFINLVRKMLHLDPFQRISPQDVLDDPYMLEDY